MRGSFKEGLELVEEIQEKLDEYALYVDTHRILVFNYKIATLYFGAGQYDKTIDYLAKDRDNCAKKLNVSCNCHI